MGSKGHCTASLICSLHQFGLQLIVPVFRKAVDPLCSFGVKIAVFSQISVSKVIVATGNIAARSGIMSIYFMLYFSRVFENLYLTGVEFLSRTYYFYSTTVKALK